jgi:hypothetical protein
MNVHAIFSEQLPYPEDYTDLPTVKAVIINENDEVFFLREGFLVVESKRMKHSKKRSTENVWKRLAR